MKTSKVMTNAALKIGIAAVVGLVIYKMLEGKEQRAHTAVGAAAGIAAAMPNIG